MSSIKQPGDFFCGAFRGHYWGTNLFHQHLKRDLISFNNLCSHRDRIKSCGLPLREAGDSSRSRVDPRSNHRIVMRRTDIRRIAAQAWVLLLLATGAVGCAAPGAVKQVPAEQKIPPRRQSPAPT
jgi:hypothetical protein